MDFPRTQADLNRTVSDLFDLGNAIAVTSSRRQFFRQLSEDFRHGDVLPVIEYTDKETETWRQVFNALAALYPSHASEEFLKAFHLLTSNGIYSESSIPQFSNLSNFMEKISGFSIRPVGGMLSPRHFLAGLGLRIFHATPHIRSNQEIQDAKEPDICHELLGHVPMFLNQDFANFSQMIGLISLGASDEDIDRLTAVYWFTVEFGLCLNEGGELRAYGAGLLGCATELRFSLSENAVRKTLNIEEVANLRNYPLMGLKPVYFVTPNLQEMYDKVRQFCASIRKPFLTSYNPVSKKIEVIHL